MRKEERNVDFLKGVVRQIYSVIVRTERYIGYLYPEIEPMLPEDITFIHSEDLERHHPDLAPKEREKLACQQHGAEFVIGIGADLAGGKPGMMGAPRITTIGRQKRPRDTKA